MPHISKLSDSRSVRRPEWRQATPRDQLVGLIGAARGIAGNISDGVYKNPEILAARASQLDDLLEQVLELSQMLQGEWPQPELEAGLSSEKGSRA